MIQEEFILDTQTLLIGVIAATLIFAFLNGLHDSSGLVATAISSRSINPRVALTVASLAELVGPFIFGTAVAETIGKDLIAPTAITLDVLVIATTSAIVWNLVTWYFGLPSSSTHALLGGLIGAVTITHGYQYLLLGGFAKVLIALFISPVIGLIVGYLFMAKTLEITSHLTPRISMVFMRVQVLNVIAMGLSHGTNDGQKSMGLITLALVAAKVQQNFVVPWWVTLLVAVAMMLGINFAGWRIMKTLGGRIYRLRSVHAFAAQTASAAIILGAAIMGAPVSTTQVVSTTIMGVGSAERIRGVRWGVAGQIITGWIMTIPASAIVAATLQVAYTLWFRS